METPETQFRNKAAGSGQPEKRQPATNKSEGKHFPQLSKGEPQTVLAEELFLHLLSIERKRAERAGRCFLLVLLEGEHVFHHSRSSLGGVIAAISHSIRETDLIGWHREGAAIGILLTEIGTADKSTIRRALLDTLSANLRGQLSAGQADGIRISFHFFPEETDGREDGGWTDRKLYPDLEKRRKAKRLSLVIKRAIDMAGSFAALVVLSPLFAIVAVAIKLSSSGPVLFRQTRVGQHGVPFSLLKFRSMRTDSDSALHQDYVQEFIRGGSSTPPVGEPEPKVYKIKDDPRVTSVGKIMRKTSLDELPQFWNVLKGEMSLVGPRPPIPYELPHYQIWHRRRILEVKPGLTGWWQIYGRSRATFDEMVRMDLRYARTWSLLLDLKILLRTPRALISGEGAY